MAASRTKPNVSSDSFYQRFSELSDEIRAKNKREDRLLDVRLKYFEREKNIRLNILRKEQHQLERTRLALSGQWSKIQHDKQKQVLPAYLNGRLDFDTTVLQRSAPDLFQADLPSGSFAEPKETPPSIPVERPKTTSTNVVRPHSAG